MKKKKVALISVIVVAIILIVEIVPKQMRTVNDPWSSTSWTVYVDGWQLLFGLLVAVIAFAIYLLKKNK